jgi:hypothetical protein
MARFMTIGYGDENGYERTDKSVRDAAHAHDEHLLSLGAEMGRAGTPVQVRNHGDSGVQTMEGPYLHSALPVAGFAIIEAESLADAVELASHSPCAVAYGVIEVWPFDQG